MMDFDQEDEFGLTVTDVLVIRMAITIIAINLFGYGEYAVEAMIGSCLAEIVCFPIVAVVAIYKRIRGSNK